MYDLHGIVFVRFHVLHQVCFSKGTFAELHDSAVAVQYVGGRGDHIIFIQQLYIILFSLLKYPTNSKQVII
ncbi:hypothetical protein FGO68_gene3447 [Halteria grandinella]|uniref:Uncharacterized protein n=1 Tax=Halteria grandinella TaxID=5974 RepID=A0A8J8NVU1_HALGN|nr:hypothetical protein FGO68_gene3447 [Halteria grandinella]